MLLMLLMLLNAFRQPTDHAIHGLYRSYDDIYLHI